MLKTIDVCVKGLNKYAKNIQGHLGKGKIFCEIEKNEYDNEAIAVYTLNQKKEKIFLSYVCKNNYEFTEEANELYVLYKNIMFEYGLDYGETNEELKEVLADKDWGKKNKTPIYDDEELKQMVKDINSNKYNFRYDYHIDNAYLFLVS